MKRTRARRQFSRIPVHSVIVGGHEEVRPAERNNRIQIIDAVRIALGGHRRKRQNAYRDKRPSRNAVILNIFTADLRCRHPVARTIYPPELSFVISIFSRVSSAN